MSKDINIGGRLHSTATGNVVAGADEILDDVKGKKQSVINAETDAAIQAETERAITAENNRYTKAETYSKQEVNSLITTPNQEYVTVEDYASLPESGEADTIYRVANWDGSLATPAADITKYSEYAWDGTGYVFLSVKSQIGEVFDISEYHSGATYADLAAALGTNGANVPVGVRKGGMSVKFKQIVTPASYTVVKTEGLDSQPTGTEIVSDPDIDSGTYNASQLSAFSTLPESTGAGNAVTYWMEVAGDTTTYTSWVITMAHSSDNKYVQFRLMAQNFTTDVTQWQGVDTKPKGGSKNLAESGGIFEETGKIAGFTNNNFSAGYYTYTVGNAPHFYDSQNKSSLSFKVNKGDVLVINGSSGSSNAALTDYEQKVIQIFDTITDGMEVTVQEDGYFYISKANANYCNIHIKNITNKIIAVEDAFLDSNIKIVTYNTDVPTTRKQVPPNRRKSGLILCYIKNSEMVVEQFIRSTTSPINDTVWANDLYWERFAKEKLLAGLLGITDLFNKSGNLSWSNGRIFTDGTVDTNSLWTHTSPFVVKKGDVIFVNDENASPYTVCPVSKVMGEGTEASPYIYTPLLSFSNAWGSYAYIADEDMNIALCYRIDTSAKVCWYSSLVFADVIRKINDTKTEYRNSISLLNRRVDDVEKDKFLNDYSLIKRGVSYEMGSISTSDGSDTYSANTVRCKELIYVGNASLIRILLTNSYRVRMYFYNAEKTLVKYFDMVYGESSYDWVINNTVVDNVKYFRIVSRDSSQSSSVTPEGVAANVTIYTGSLSAHYLLPNLKTNKLVTSLAHQGIGTGINSDGDWLATGANRLSAFYGAYKMGCDGNLANTQWTSDNVPVCIHDASFVDAVSGNTITIENVTYDELQTHPLNTNGEKVPALDDVLYLCKCLGMKLYLVNMAVNDSKIGIVYNLVSKYQMRDDVIWMTDTTSAAYILTRYPTAHIALCQTPIAGSGSTDYSVIEDLIIAASSILSTYNRCKITLWVTSAHSTDNLKTACINLPAGVELGTFNVETSDIPRVLPYVKIMSMHSASIGSESHNIEMALAEKYPIIVSYGYCKNVI